MDALEELNQAAHRAQAERDLAAAWSETRAVFFLRPKLTFWATFAARLDMSPSWRVPTAATDGRRLWINPDFYLTASAPRRLAIIAHEIAHVAFKHHIRRGPHRDAFGWNVAADLAINDSLRASGFDTAPDWLYPETFGQPAGLSAEAYFDALASDQRTQDAATKHGVETAGTVQEPPRHRDAQAPRPRPVEQPKPPEQPTPKQPAPPPQDGQAGQDGDDQAEPQAGQDGPPQAGQDGQDGQDDGQDGDGAGSAPPQDGQPGDGQAQGGTAPGDGQDGTGWTDGEADAQEEEARVDQIVVEANAACEARGIGPAGGLRDLPERRPPAPDIDEALRDFIAPACDDYSFRRPSRRGIAAGLILPTRYSEQLAPVGVTLDTSGSIGTDELAAFVARLARIVELAPVALRLIYHHSHVYHRQTWQPNDGPLELAEIETGGTDFAQAIHDATEPLDETGEEPAALVMLTDCCCPWPDEPPAVPVLIVRQGYGAPPPWPHVLIDIEPGT